MATAFAPREVPGRNLSQQQLQSDAKNEWIQTRGGEQTRGERRCSLLRVVLFSSCDVLFFLFSFFCRVCSQESDIFSATCHTHTAAEKIKVYVTGIHI
jgi:hypothetical protein